jgi:hypothetical protein
MVRRPWLLRVVIALGLLALACGLLLLLIMLGREDDALSWARCVLTGCPE